MKRPLVTIGLVLYKGEKYLKKCLQSLVAQDYPNLEFLFLDQSPNAEAFKYIQAELPEIDKRTQIEVGENKWHSGGHNHLIRKSKGEYYLCASNDMHYPKDLVSTLVEELEKNENAQYGSATGKLLQWDFENEERTEIIDSCGIGIKANHHFYDIGQGQIDSDQFSRKIDIFGPSGALGIYRRKALNDIAHEGKRSKLEYFDELLHYKNDVDLAYRLQWAGHKSLFIPEAKVYHARQLSSTTKRKSRSRWSKESSFFGQQAVILKNFSPKFSKKTKLQTLKRQWLSLGYISVFEPYLMKQFKELKGRQKEMERKKLSIKRIAKASDIESLMN